MGMITGFLEVSGGGHSSVAPTSGIVPAALKSYSRENSLCKATVVTCLSNNVRNIHIAAESRYRFHILLMFAVE